MPDISKLKWQDCQYPLKKVIFVSKVSMCGNKYCFTYSSYIWDTSDDMSHLKPIPIGERVF